MRLERSIKLERELKSAIKDAYRETIHFASTHEEHLDRMRRYVWDTKRYKDSPRWLKTFLHGVDQTCFDLLYEVGLSHHTLTPQLGPLAAISIGTDGRKFGPNDDTWLAESSEYKLTLKCVHVWRARWEQGEYKPF